MDCILTQLSDLIYSTCCICSRISASGEECSYKANIYKVDWVILVKSYILVELCQSDSFQMIYKMKMTWLVFDDDDGVNVLMISCIF